MNWIAFSSVVTAIALVVQLVILIALLVEIRKTTEKVNQLTGDLRARIGPILTRVQIMLDDTQPKISSLVSDAAHIVYLARGPAQKVARVFTDSAQHLRGQLRKRDRILTGTLEALEDAGSQFRRGLWGPVQKASAVIKGIKVGIDLLRPRRAGRSSSDDRLEQEE